MKTNVSKLRGLKGVTLIELTVVIVVLLALVSILFLGARAWIRGSQKAQCVLIQRNVQQGLRSYQNINRLDTPIAGGPAGTAVIPDNLRAAGFLSTTEVGPPAARVNAVIHPGNTTNLDQPNDGLYTYVLGAAVPPAGTMYIRCTSATAAQYTASPTDSAEDLAEKAAIPNNHIPSNFSDW